MRLIRLLLAITLLMVGTLLSAQERSAAEGKTTANRRSQEQVSLKPLEFLIDWQAEPTYLGIYYAKHFGAFKNLGLDVSVVQSWGANEAAAAIAAGKYKIGTSSGGATVIANSSGAGLVSTAVIYRRLPTAVFGLKKAGVRNPKDLAGKTVGIYAKSITGNEFDAFMKLNGLKKDDVNVVSISGPDLPLILAGRVDAVLNYFELSPTQLALEHETFQLLLDKYGVKGYGLNVITSRKTYEEDTKLIEGITQAVLLGYRKGCANREAATASFLKEFPEKNSEYVKSSWAKVCKFIGGDYGTQTVQGWQSTIDLYGKLDLLNGPVSPADIMPRE
ncbi:MAG: ABC transporter substrate-binding protein [Pseudomonadota bacterium]|nr:ABC transporter substrate-binding protein [Pseudomonadota bacterium]